MLHNFLISEAEKQELAHHLGRYNGRTLHSTWCIGDMVEYQGRKFLLYDHQANDQITKPYITNYDTVLIVNWEDINVHSYIKLGS